MTIRWWTSSPNKVEIQRRSRSACAIRRAALLGLFGDTPVLPLRGRQGRGLVALLLRQLLARLLSTPTETINAACYRPK
jgi:hypothetical protein